MLKTKWRTTKMGGSLSKRDAVPREAEEIENADDPRGQFAAFLRTWVTTQVAENGGTRTQVLESVAGSIGVKLRAVQKWTKGKSGPNLGDLQSIAKVMGFRSWDQLAVAVVRHSKHRRK